MLCLKVENRSGSLLFLFILTAFLWHKRATQDMSDQLLLLLNKEKKKANLILNLILSFVSVFWSSKLLKLVMVSGGSSTCAIINPQNKCAFRVLLC